jgi:hypothetical protein
MAGFMKSPRYAQVVRETDGPKVVSAISPARPSGDICVVAIVENKSFLLIVVTLILLIVVALWQFYSLAWGDSLSLSYHVRSPSVSPSVAAAPD